MDVSQCNRLWSVVETEIDGWQKKGPVSCRPFEELYRNMKWLVDDGCGEWVEDKIREKVTSLCRQSLGITSADINAVVKLWDDITSLSTNIREIYGAHISPTTRDILPLSAATLIQYLHDNNLLVKHITEIVSYLLAEPTTTHNNEGTAYQQYLHVIHLTFSEYNDLFSRVGLLFTNIVAEQSATRPTNETALELLFDILQKLERSQKLGLPHTLRNPFRKGLDEVLRTPGFARQMSQWPASFKHDGYSVSKTLTSCKVLLTSEVVLKADTAMKARHVGDLLQSVRKLFVSIIDEEAGNCQLIVVLCKLYDVFRSTTTTSATATTLLEEVVSGSTLSNTLTVDLLVHSIDFAVKNELSSSNDTLQSALSALLSHAVAVCSNPLFVGSLVHRISNRLLLHKDISFEKELVVTDALQAANVLDPESLKNITTMITDIRDQTIKTSKGRVYILNSLSWPRLPSGTTSYLVKPSSIATLESQAEQQYKSTHKGTTLFWVESATKITLQDTTRKLLISCSYLQAVILMTVWGVDGDVDKSESDILKCITAAGTDDVTVEKRNEIKRCLQQLQSNGVLISDGYCWKVASGKHPKRRVNCLLKSVSCLSSNSSSGHIKPVIEAALTRHMKRNRKMPIASLVGSTSQELGAAVKLDQIRRLVMSLAQRGYFEIDDNDTVVYVA